MAAKPITQPCLPTWTSWRCKQLTSRDLLAFATVFLGGCLCMVRILPMMCCMGPHAHHADPQHYKQQQQQQACQFPAAGARLGQAWPTASALGRPATPSCGPGCKTWPLSWRLACGCWTGLPAWPMQHLRNSQGSPITRWVLAWHHKLTIVLGAALQVSLANIVAGWCIGCLVIAWHPWAALLGMGLTAVSLPGWQRPLSSEGGHNSKAAGPTAANSTTAPAARAGWWRLQLLWRPPGWLWLQPGVRSAALLVVRLVSSCIPWLWRGPLRPPEPYLTLLLNTHISYHVQFAWIGWMAYTLPVFGTQQVVAGLLSWVPMAYAASTAEPATGSLLPHIRLWAASFLLIVLLPYFGTMHLERSLKQQYAQQVCRLGAGKGDSVLGNAAQEEATAEFAQAPRHTARDAAFEKACDGGSTTSSSSGSSSKSSSIRNRASSSSNSQCSTQGGAVAAPGSALQRRADSAPSSMLRNAAVAGVRGAAEALRSMSQANLTKPVSATTMLDVHTSRDTRPPLPPQAPSMGRSAAVMPSQAAAGPVRAAVPAAAARAPGSSNPGGSSSSGNSSGSGSTQRYQMTPLPQPAQQQWQGSLLQQEQQQWKGLQLQQQQQQWQGLQLQQQQWQGLQLRQQQQQQQPGVRDDVAWRQHLETALGPQAAESILASAAAAAKASMVYVPVCRILPVGVKVGPHHDVAQLEPTLNECVKACLDEELQLQQQQQQECQLPCSRPQGPHQELAVQQGPGAQLQQHSLPVLLETVCFKGCVQLLASVYHARRPFLAWQQQAAPLLPPSTADATAATTGGVVPAAGPGAVERSDLGPATYWDASSMANRLLQMVDMALPPPDSGQALEVEAVSAGSSPLLEVAVGPAGAALVAKPPAGASASSAEPVPVGEQPGYTGMGGIARTSWCGPPLVRLLWQDRAAVAAGVDGQVVTLVLDREEHSIPSNSCRHPGSYEWSSSDRSSPYEAGLLGGNDGTSCLDSSPPGPSRLAGGNSHIRHVGCSSSNESDSEGEPADMSCTHVSSRRFCQSSSGGSDLQEVPAAEPLVRVLLSSKQQVVLDAVVPLQPYLRLALPRLELGSYNLAIVPADVPGVGPRRNAAAPLLLHPLLVLPPPAADELQQLWEAVSGLLAPASAAGVALHTPTGAAGDARQQRGERGASVSAAGTASRLGITTAASTSRSCSSSCSSGHRQQQMDLGLPLVQQRLAAAGVVAGGWASGSSSSSSSSESPRCGGAPASTTAAPPQQPGITSAPAEPLELVAQQYKAIAWQAVVAGLVQDVGYVISWSTGAARLSGDGRPTAQQQPGDAGELSGGGCIAPPELARGGSCTAASEGHGPNNAVPGGEAPAARVLGMLDMQGVLQPLLHYLAAHNMHAVAHTLVDLVLCHSWGSSETEPPALPQAPAQQLEQGSFHSGGNGSSSSSHVQQARLGPCSLTQSILQRHAEAASAAAAASAAEAASAAAAASTAAASAAAAAAPAAAEVAGAGAEAPDGGALQQPQQEPSAEPVTSDASSWDSCSVDEASCHKASAEQLWAKEGAPAAASCSGAGGVAQGAAAAAAAVQSGDRWQPADLAAESSAAGWRVAARQLLRGFADPRLEAAYLHYMYVTTQLVDQLSAIFYPIFAISLFLQEGLPPLAAWGDPWRVLAAHKVEVRFVVVCAIPPLLLQVVRPYLSMGSRREWAIVLWELWLVGIVFSNLWDGLGVAERITQAINMTPSNSFFLALQMCVFKVLNKQVRFVSLMPPFLLESLGHMLLLRQRAGAALASLLLRHGAILVLGSLHSAVTELGSRRRFLSGLAAQCCGVPEPTGRQGAGLAASTASSCRRATGSSTGAAC